MNAGYLLPVIVPVCDDLAACAMLFSGQRRARMTFFLDRLVKVAVLCPLPESLFVEQIPKLDPGYLDDLKVIGHD